VTVEHSQPTVCSGRSRCR